MSEKIERLLAGNGGNYMLPFFWQHGEDEETLRHYMRVIHDANISAVCVESRPHPDFCGPKWWADMDAILDEAEKLGMKVWILDDSHFPTGYANGAMKDRPAQLQRWSVTCRQYALKQGETVSIPKTELDTARPYGEAENAKMFFMNPDNTPQYGDDRLLGVYAVRMDGVSGFADKGRRQDIEGLVTESGLTWTAPEGEWKIYVVQLTRNRGVHKDYINMMDRESCRVLLDAVYEPHWEHYKDLFGTTIAGFFSDEPELGDGVLYDFHNELGCSESMDYPWSRELEERLKEDLGGDFACELALLWENGAEDGVTAEVRYTYMDWVSKLVRECFSFQLGDWCREKGVRYIGHLIEDNNHHTKTGTSLGHYFRGLAGQDMAGIDDIGGQVMPGQEDVSYDMGVFRQRDGNFYHYGLGKLASSAAAIEPLKKGDSMCEIFGAYGWKEGVRLEKYLIDHFMVRGVNHFVPHAFSPKEFPDPDCPPHFYAHGHNPQYRHFGALMAYANRVCELISGGRHIASVAVLYHAEADWMGGAMPADVVGRVLYDNQIDYDFVPLDVFTDKDTYLTAVGGRTLKVNTQTYKALIVPKSQFLVREALDAVKELQAAGVPVFFVDALPEGASGEVVLLERLVPEIKAKAIHELTIEPADDRVRCYHYEHMDGTAVYMFVNEGDKLYSGQVVLKDSRRAYGYDAWENRVRPLEVERSGDELTVKLELAPLKSTLVILDDEQAAAKLLIGASPAITADGEDVPFAAAWKRSTCSSLSYPAFDREKEVTLPDNLAEESPEFSGFVRYENSFTGRAGTPIALEITDAYEGVEVFVNGGTLGIQVAPPFLYDITDKVKDGGNLVRIEVATTLEREMAARNDQPQFIPGMAAVPENPSGINGIVRLVEI